MLLHVYVTITNPLDGLAVPSCQPESVLRIAYVKTSSQPVERIDMPQPPLKPAQSWRQVCVLFKLEV